MNRPLDKLKIKGSVFFGSMLWSVLSSTNPYLGLCTPIDVYGPDQAGA